MRKGIEEFFIDWECNVFGYGYGNGEHYILPQLKHFLTLCSGDKGYDYRDLEAQLTKPVAWLFINILCRADILEYGVSPRFAWLTKKGVALKDFVDEKTAEQLVEIVTGKDTNYIYCYPGICNCGISNSVCLNPFW